MTAILPALARARACAECRHADTRREDHVHLAGAGEVACNFRVMDFRRPAGQATPVLDEFAASVGTDWETYEGGVDILWGGYQWLDRAPLGRNEAGFRWRRHDEYDDQ
jgi:predicted dithiol-disulfide oxidoreductase (DUF899 family)